MLKLIRPLFTIQPREAEFTQRGFCCSRPQVRERLERVGKTFLQGYHAGLEESYEAALANRLSEIEPDYRGFAYEGCAMALALVDGITLRGRRFPRFLSGAGRPHTYMLHVGAGWACARLPWLRRRIELVIRKFDPVLRWLVIDGYGFHQGYFHWQANLAVPALSEDARHVFYQGLGRSLWFVKGADAREIFQTIEAFAPEYRSDMWSGIGLACAYAGGMDRAEIQELRRRANGYGAVLAQGAAFAAGARQRAGNPAWHTDLACAVLCGLNAQSAAALCDETLRHVNVSQPCPYQHWRRLLQENFRHQETIDGENLKNDDVETLHCNVSAP